MSVISEFLKFYKEKKSRERKMRQLAKAPFDYAFLQALVDGVGEGRRAAIEITQLDGTRIKITPMKDIGEKRDFERLLE